jgi:dienelactone hydrolase
MRRGRFIAGGLAVLALTAASSACREPGPFPRTTTTTTSPTVTGPTTTVPGGSDTIKGPAPTDALLNATQGPFQTSSFTVPRGSGYGGGTVFYPTQAGRYGGVAVVPGFVSPQSSIRWYGPRLASHGFVVITIDTNSGGDQPASRGTQLNAALRTLTSDSRVADRVDPTRLAVMGWSMGGGGVLSAASSNPNIKAGIPLAPWHSTKSWSSLRTPIMIVQCSGDAVASNSSHSERFYASLGSTEKAIFAAPGSHGCVTSPNTTIARMSVSWLKRFVDNDTRYSDFVCRGPGAGGSNFRSTCPV